MGPGRLLLTALLAIAAALAAGSCAPYQDPASSLSIWEQMDPAEQDLLRRHLDEFEAAHPGVTVDTVHFETEQLRNRFQTAALAGAGPDLAYGPPDQVGPFSIMGLIEPLETVLSADSLALFIESAKASLDGHVYALADQVGNHLTLVYNRALIDDVPADTDAWIRQLEQLTVDDDGDGRVDQYGLVFNLAEPFWLLPWLGGFGSWVMDEAGTPTLDEPGMSEALTFMRDLIQRGVTPASCDYPLADTLFKEGSAAYIVNGPWSWQSYRDAGIDVGLAVLPRVSQTGLYPSPSTASKGYCMNVHVPPERRELVAELLSFLTSAHVVANASRDLGTLPSRIDVAALPWIAEDPVLQISWAQLEKGRPMPIVPEMRVIWDTLRPGYQQVLNGGMKPKDAGPWMQRQAERKIEEMRL